MSEGHWIVNKVIAGHSMAFNMDTLVTMWAAMAFLIIVSFIATRKLTIFPTKLQLVFENILGYFSNLVNNMMPKEGQKHFPLIASLFLFIVTANIMGQLPFKMIQLKQGELASPTNDIISMLVEILELFTRPLTLALRLFGNILAGEILITALLGLCAWGLPLPIMFFEILVACVQALVFTMLTTVYIATAVNTEE